MKILSFAAQVQVARVTGAYPVWLSIFTVLVYGCISVLRVISGTQGYIQSVIFAIAVIIGQFAEKLWLQVGKSRPISRSQQQMHVCACSQQIADLLPLNSELNWASLLLPIAGLQC